MGPSAARAKKRAVLVMAHVPPPVHGQSKMVELVLRILRQGDDRTDIFHVDTRYSSSTQDVGSLRPRKILAALRYAMSAVRLARRHGVRAMYYVPAPPRYGPLLRDILVLMLSRPFYPSLILHWHAAGLGTWIEGRPWIVRALAQKVLGGAALSIPLSKYSERDASIFGPRSSVVLPNAVDDPEPSFDVGLLAERVNRANILGAAVNADSETGQSATIQFNALFMGLLCEEKGVLIAIDAVAQLVALLDARKSRVRPVLRLCGAFASQEEEDNIRARMQDANRSSGYEVVRLVGFVDGEHKREELRQADCFVFPTFYCAENAPLVLIEAMASGLHVVTTSWRGIPEMLPSYYGGIVPPRDANAVALAMLSSMSENEGLLLRKHFLDAFGVQAFAERFAAAVNSELDAHS